MITDINQKLGTGRYSSKTLKWVYNNVPGGRSYLIWMVQNHHILVKKSLVSALYIDNVIYNIVYGSIYNNCDVSRVPTEVLSYYCNLNTCSANRRKIQHMQTIPVELFESVLKAVKNNIQASFDPDDQYRVGAEAAIGDIRQLILLDYKDQLINNER